MEIKDLQANQGKVDLVVEVMHKEDPRTFEKFGKSGKVCNAKVKDASGQVTMTLWNEDVDKVSVGDRIHVENGWCSEYKGEKQVSAGKFGKIEVLGSTGKTEKAQPAAKPAAKQDKQADKTVYTNDPGVLAGQGLSDDGDEENEDEEPSMGDEEFIED